MDAASLNTELTALEQLVELLDEEQAALADGNLAQVNALLDEKEQQLAVLGKAAARRSNMLAAQRLPEDRDGMERWLASQPAPMRSAWIRVLDLARRTRELNEMNGRLLQARMEACNQALGVLGAGAGNLYRSDGLSAPNPSSGRGIIA